MKYKAPKFKYARNGDKRITIDLEKAEGKAPAIIKSIHLDEYIIPEF